MRSMYQHVLTLIGRAGSTLHYEVGIGMPVKFFGIDERTISFLRRWLRRPACVRYGFWIEAFLGGVGERIS